MSESASSTPHATAASQHHTDQRTDWGNGPAITLRRG
jgi:hypothetical protein